MSDVLGVLLRKTCRERHFKVTDTSAFIIIALNVSLIHSTMSEETNW